MKGFLEKQMKTLKQLVQENAAWARRIGFNEAKKLTRFPEASLWFDDVVGGALEGLWQAAQSWDGRGTFRGLGLYSRSRRGRVMRGGG